MKAFGSCLAGGIRSFVVCRLVFFFAWSIVLSGQNIERKRKISCSLAESPQHPLLTSILDLIWFEFVPCNHLNRTATLSGNSRLVVIISAIHWQNKIPMKTSELWNGWEFFVQISSSFFIPNLSQERFMLSALFSQLNNSFAVIWQVPLCETYFHFHFESQMKHVKLAHACAEWKKDFFNCGSAW